MSINGTECLKHWLDSIFQRVGLEVILGFVLMITGCAVSAPIPEDRYQAALKLVDTGTELLRARQFSQARSMYELAYDMAPLASAVDGQGCIALLNGEFEEAERLFRAAYEMDKGYDEALANLALLHDLRGEKERSEEVYQRYLMIRPGSASARNNLAAVQFDLGRERGQILTELQKAQGLSGRAVIKSNLQELLEERE